MEPLDETALRDALDRLPTPDPQADDEDLPLAPPEAMALFFGEMPETFEDTDGEA